MAVTAMDSLRRWRTTAYMACTVRPVSAFSSPQVWTSKPSSGILGRGHLCREYSDVKRRLRSWRMLTRHVFFSRRGWTVRSGDCARWLIRIYWLQRFKGRKFFDIPEMFLDAIDEMGWDAIDIATIEKVLASAPFEAVVCTVGKLLAWCLIWRLFAGGDFNRVRGMVHLYASDILPLPSDIVLQFKHVV